MIANKIARFKFVSNSLLFIDFLININYSISFLLIHRIDNYYWCIYRQPKYKSYLSTLWKINTDSCNFLCQPWKFETLIYFLIKNSRLWTSYRQTRFILCWNNYSAMQIMRFCSSLNQNLTLVALGVLQTIQGN